MMIMTTIILQQKLKRGRFRDGAMCTPIVCEISFILFDGVPRSVHREDSRAGERPHGSGVGVRSRTVTDAKTTT